MIYFFIILILFTAFGGMLCSNETQSMVTTFPKTDPLRTSEASTLNNWNNLENGLNKSLKIKIFNYTIDDESVSPLAHTSLLKKIMKLLQEYWPDAPQLSEDLKTDLNGRELERHDFDDLFQTVIRKMTDGPIRAAEDEDQKIRNKVSIKSILITIDDGKDYVDVPHGCNINYGNLMGWNNNNWFSKFLEHRKSRVFSELDKEKNGNKSAIKETDENKSTTDELKTSNLLTDNAAEVNILGSNTKYFTEEETTSSGANTEFDNGTSTTSNSDENDDDDDQEQNEHHHHHHHHSNSRKKRTSKTKHLRKRSKHHTETSKASNEETTPLPLHPSGLTTEEGEEKPTELLDQLKTEVGSPGNLLKDSTNSNDVTEDHNTVGPSKYAIIGETKDDAVNYKNWFKDVVNYFKDSNSTKPFLSEHFLLYSGGTNRSATDVSDLNGQNKQNVNSTTLPKKHENLTEDEGTGTKLYTNAIDYTANEMTAPPKDVEEVAEDKSTASATSYTDGNKSEASAGVTSKIETTFK